MAKPTAKDKRYFTKVVELGCCICQQEPEIHHETGAGLALKSSNEDVMPLCHRHHRTGGYGVAIHAGVKEWEKIHGTQKHWIKWTKEKAL